MGIVHKAGWHANFVALVGHMMVEACMEKLISILSDLGLLGAIHARFDPIVDSFSWAFVWTFVGWPLGVAHMLEGGPKAWLGRW